MDMAHIHNEGHRLNVKVTRSYYVKIRSSSVGGVSCGLCLVIRYLPYSAVANSVCVCMTTTPSSTNDMKVNVTRSRSKVRKLVFGEGVHECGS